VDAKRIRDPIHYVPVEPEVLGVLDEPAVQRLRHVRQLGTASLIYPGANHTRFEHSLGACHLGGRAAASLGLSAEDARDLRLALLLHDVGHGPFSHLSEPAMRRTLGVGHKDLGIQLVRGELRGAIERARANPERIAAMIDGRGELGPLVSGDIDLDRMDYLLRDSHYTGVHVGVDLGRLLTGLARRASDPALREDARHRGAVVLREEALHAAELLLLARFLMYTTVYYHHASRVAERMVARAIDLLLEAGEVAPRAMARMDDVDLIHAMRASPTHASVLARMVDQRELLKPAAMLPIQDAGAAAERLRDPGACAAAERALAEQAGCDPRMVIVDLPDLPVLPEIRAPILGSDGALRPLSERSTLVASLHKAQLDHWRLRVYGPAAARAALAQAARKVLAA
jgi:HD superfamily phosphohydrolase